MSLKKKCFCTHTEWTIIWPWGYSGLNYSFILLWLIQVQDFDTSFNTDAIRQNQFAVQNMLHWLSFKNEPSLASAVGRRLGRQTFCILASRAESRWDGEKWPLILDGIEKEWELTVIQTAFHADPRLRISHAATVCCTGRTVTPANRAPEKRLSKKKDTLYLNDVWLPLRVKCSLHNWKHLPALHWFWYNYGSSFGCNGSTFPLNTVSRSTNIILFIWLGEGAFTFSVAFTTKSNPS